MEPAKCLGTKFWFFRNTPDGNQEELFLLVLDGGSSSQMNDISELFNFLVCRRIKKVKEFNPRLLEWNFRRMQRRDNKPVVDPNLQTPNPTANNNRHNPDGFASRHRGASRPDSGNDAGSLCSCGGSQQQNQQQVPEFSVNIPDELVQGLSAEDPIVRKRSLEQLGSGLGQMVLHQANQQVAALYTHISNAIRKWLRA